MKTPSGSWRGRNPHKTPIMPSRQPSSRQTTRRQQRGGRGRPPVSPTPTPARTRASRSTPESYRETASIASSSTSEGSEESLESLVADDEASTPVFATPTSTSTPSTKGRPPGSVSTTRSTKRSLEPWQQKLLAEDVEEFGGLAAVKAKQTNKRSKFRDFCDQAALKDEERAHLYDIPDSKNRERVRHRIDYWVSIGTDSYQSILSEWGIIPAAFREIKAPEEKPKQKKQAQTPLTVDSLSLEFDSLCLSSTKKDLFPSENIIKMDKTNTCKFLFWQEPWLH